MGTNFQELLRVLYHMKDFGVPPSKWLVGYAENGKLSVQKEDGDSPADLAEIIAAFVQAGRATGEAAGDPRHDRQVCIDAGMNDHIGKPVNPELLYETLLKWLTQSAQR